MASIRKKPGTKFWYACFTDNAGRQQQRSTKTTNRNLALKMALTFEAPYSGNYTIAQAHAVLSGITQDVLGESLVSVPIEQFLYDWLETKKAPSPIEANGDQEDEDEKGPESHGGTHTRYKKTVERFLEHLGQKRTRHINSVTPQDVSSFQRRLASELSPSSANTELKTLRSAFSYAVKNGLRLDNPTKGIELLDDTRPKDERRRPFTRVELDQVYAAAQGEWRGIILAGVYTGQRLGDIGTLIWNEIDLPANTISVKTEKMGRRVIIPIARPLREYLDTLTVGKGDDSIFPLAHRMHQEANNTSRTLSAAFHKILVQAGLTPKRPKANTGRGHSNRRRTSQLCFHSLRHTATSFLKKAGVPESVVRDIIGHESSIVSMQYTHIDEEQKATAIGKLETVWEPTVAPPKAP